MPDIGLRDAVARLRRLLGAQGFTAHTLQAQVCLGRAVALIEADPAESRKWCRLSLLAIGGFFEPE